MKCKLMYIIGGNKKFFVLAICLMGLMFSSCHGYYYCASLESGEIKTHLLSLSADIKMKVYRDPYYKSFDSLIHVSIYKKKGILPNYNFSQLDIRCFDNHSIVTNYNKLQPQYEKGKIVRSKWTKIDASKKENQENCKIHFGFIPPHMTDTLLIIPNNFMILSDGTPLFKDTIKIIMDPFYMPRYREKYK